MLDSYNRVIDYVRISITDRCNLRCIYCMPEEGVSLVSHDEIMTFDEIVRICTVLAKLGVRKVRLTGGEPLLKRDLADLISRIREIPEIEKLTLTTNGVLLADKIDELAKAGIDGINISLDTMNREKFSKITRRDEFERVMEGIRKTLEYPEIKVKINCVPVDIDESDIRDLVLLAENNEIHVRFIEIMPIGLGKNFTFRSEEEIKKVIESFFGIMKPYGEKLGNGPAKYWSIDGFKGRIGFISAMTHKFCNECNRIRLTSQGFLKTCLQYDTGADLLKIIRSGGGDSLLEKAICDALAEKPMEHGFLEKKKFKEEKKLMYRIGG